MEEIIAQSKSLKAEKARRKDEHMNTFESNDSEILLLQKQETINNDGNRREDRTENVYNDSKEMDEWNNNNAQESQDVAVVRIITC